MIARELGRGKQLAVIGVANRQRVVGTPYVATLSRTLLLLFALLIVPHFRWRDAEIREDDARAGAAQQGKILEQFEVLRINRDDDIGALKVRPLGPIDAQRGR